MTKHSLQIRTAARCDSTRLVGAIAHKLVVGHRGVVVGRLRHDRGPRLPILRRMTLRGKPIPAKRNGQEFGGMAGRASLSSVVSTPTPIFSSANFRVPAAACRFDAEGHRDERVVVR